VEAIERSRGSMRRDGVRSAPEQRGYHPLMPVVVRADDAVYAPVQPFDDVLPGAELQHVFRDVVAVRVGGREHAMPAVRERKQLREAWERFDADDDAWVAIITGVQDAFFTGADLKRYVPEITKFQKQIAEQGLTEINGYRLDDGTRAVLRNVDLYKPVVAAVN